MGRGNVKNEELRMKNYEVCWLCCLSVVQAIGDMGCRLFSAGRNLACVVCGCEAGVLKCNGNFIEVVSKCSDNRILLLLGGGVPEGGGGR